MRGKFRWNIHVDGIEIAEREIWRRLRQVNYTYASSQGQLQAPSSIEHVCVSFSWLTA